MTCWDDVDDLDDWDDAPDDPPRREPVRPRFLGVGLTLLLVDRDDWR